MTGQQITLATQLNELYGLGCGHDHVMELAFGDRLFELPSFIDIPGLISKALSSIFSSKKPDVEPALMELTFSVLDEAINLGYGKIEYGKPNYEFAEQLRGSAALFAAKKSWAQAKELAKLAIKENGHQRTWKEFEELAKPIVNDYNMVWLKTEFNTAIRAARSAKEWQRYEETADLFPNLKYLASRAATPREEHKPFYGVVKPITDDFWVKHMPPSAWNCMCGVKQTDDDVTDEEPSGPVASAGLDNNPGITGKLFADSHPYNQDLTGNEKEDINQKSKDYVTKRRQTNSK